MSASAFSSPATGAGKDDTPTQSVSATSATEDGGDDTAAQSMAPPGPVAPLGLMCRGAKKDFWCSRCGSNWTDDEESNPTLWCMLCGDEEGAYKDMVLFQYGQSRRILRAAAALPPAAPLAGATAAPLAPTPAAAATPHAAPPATPTPAAAVAPHATPPEDAMLMVGENFTREGQEVFDDDGEVYVLT